MYIIIIIGSTRLRTSGLQPWQGQFGSLPLGHLGLRRLSSQCVQIISFGVTWIQNQFRIEQVWNLHYTVSSTVTSRPVVPSNSSYIVQLYDHDQKWSIAFIAQHCKVWLSQTNTVSMCVAREEGMTGCYVGLRCQGRRMFPGERELLGVGVCCYGRGSYRVCCQGTICYRMLC